MTSSADALAELDAALVSAGVTVRAPTAATPPCVHLFGGAWSDLEQVGRGQVSGGYRVVMIAGRWDQTAGAAQLAALRDDVVAAIRTLNGWRLDSVSGDRSIDAAGARFYSAEVGASRLIDV